MFDFYLAIFILLVSSAAIFVSHILSRKRNEEFLYYLDQILNQQNDQKK